MKLSTVNFTMRAMFSVVSLIKYCFNTILFSFTEVLPNIKHSINSSIMKLVTN